MAFDIHVAFRSFARGFLNVISRNISFHHIIDAYGCANSDFTLVSKINVQCCINLYFFCLTAGGSVERTSMYDLNKNTERYVISDKLSWAQNVFVLANN